MADTQTKTGYEARVANGWVAVWAWRTVDDGERSDERCVFVRRCPGNAIAAADALLTSSRS